MSDETKKPEPLEKASPNVKANRTKAHLGTSARIIQYLRNRTPVSSMEFGSTRRVGFKADPGKGIGIVSSEPKFPAHHELGHALTTPTGQSLAEHQEALGRPLSEDDTRWQQVQEHTANAVQDGIARRAGTAPTEPEQRRGNVMWGGQREANYREGQNLGQQVLRDIDEGVKVYNKDTGRMEPGTSVHAKINLRARAAVKKTDETEVGEKLEKRSKNVREQTRNISPEQAHQRIMGYLRRKGINAQETSREVRRGFGVTEDGQAWANGDAPPRRSFPPAHEAGHLLMTPAGKPVTEYQKELNADQDHTVPVPNWHHKEEYAADAIEHGIHRRAGAPVNTLMADVLRDAPAWERKFHAKEQRPHFAAGTKELQAFDEGRKVPQPGGKFGPGASVHAKINERAMAKNEDQSKQLTPPQWLGRPILHQDHLQDLETRAALNEFHARMPRHEAEQKAHDDYVKEQRERAAAHHLAGMKASSATGNHEDARKHWALYDLHLKALGKESIGAIPPEIEKRMMEDGDKPVYKFKAHKGDLYALHEPTKDIAGPAGQPIQKAELAKGDVVDFKSAKDKALNQRALNTIQNDAAPSSKPKGFFETGKPCLRIHEAGNWTLCGETTDITPSEYMGAGRPSLKHMQSSNYCDRCVESARELAGQDMQKAEAKQCKWRLGERRCKRMVTSGYCHSHRDHWANKINQKQQAQLEDVQKSVRGVIGRVLAKSNVINFPGGENPPATISDPQAQPQQEPAPVANIQDARQKQAQEGMNQAMDGLGEQFEQGPKIQESIKQHLIGLGFHHDYAHEAAADMLEGWYNDDRFPLWNSPHYTPGCYNCGRSLDRTMQDARPTHGKQLCTNCQQKTPPKPTGPQLVKAEAREAAIELLKAVAEVAKSQLDKLPK